MGTYRLSRRITIIGLAFYGSLICGAVTLSSLARNDVLSKEAERQEASLIADSLSVKLVLTQLVHRIDALGAIVRLAQKAEIEQLPVPMSAVIRELQDNLVGMDNLVALVTAVSPNGDVLWSNLGVPSAAVNLSDREHIRALRQHGFVNYIGGPMIGRISGLETIQFSSAAVSQGDVIGFSVVSVSAPKLLANLYQHLGILDTTITLMRRDGIYIAGEREGQLVSSSLILDVNVDFGRSDVDPARNMGLVARLSRKNSAMSAEAKAALRAIDIFIFASLFISFVLTAALVVILRAREVLAVEGNKRASLALFDEMTRELDDLVVITNVISDLSNFERIYTSPSVTHFTGYTVEEFLELRVPLLVEDPAGSTHNERMERLIRDGRLGPLRLRLTRRDGSVLWVEQTLKLIRSPSVPDGGYRLISRLLDLTDRDNLESALSSQTTRLNTLLSSARILLFEVNGTKVEGGVESAIWSIPIEIQPQECNPISSAFGEIVNNPDYDKPRQSALSDAIRHGHSTWEIEIASSNGAAMYVRLMFAAVSVTIGRYRVIGIGLDFTREYHMKKTLEEAERLAEIGRVAAMIAHDLNNPLSGIGLNAELLLSDIPIESDLGRRLKQRADRIPILVKRAAHIVENVLEFSRSSLGKTEPFSAQLALTNVIENADDRIQRERLSLNVDLPTEPVTLLGNQVAFEQLVFNLVSNAFDAYSPVSAGDKAPRVVIVMTTEAAQAVIRVSDQAGGIPEDILPNIFKPFFTTKAPGKGTGLGLAIASRACNLMGGSLVVNNIPGGAEFTIRLPLATQANWPATSNCSRSTRIAS